MRGSSNRETTNMVVFPWRTTTLVFITGFEHCCLFPVLSLSCSACDLSMKPCLAMALYPHGFEQNCFLQKVRQTVTCFVEYLQTAEKTEDQVPAGCKSNQWSSTSFSNYDYLNKSNWLFLLNFLLWRLLSAQIHFPLLGTIRFISRTKYRTLSSGQDCILSIVIFWSFFFQPWLQKRWFFAPN